MEYKIEKKEPFKIVGKKKRVPIQFEGVNQEIVEIAKSITPEQRERLQSYGDIEPHQVVNASFNLDDGWEEEKGSLDHMIGYLTTKEENFEEFDVVEVPALTWAIFSSTGEFPKVMQETWAKVASQWLPSSDYELVDAPNISFTGDLSNPNKVYSEIWFAVKKKSK